MIKKIRLKRRSPDDSVYKAAQEFTEAKERLFIEMCKALYIDRFVEWLSKKLR